MEENAGEVAGMLRARSWLATIPKVPASSANTKTQRIGMSVTSTHG